jgi:JmjC domain, hydroxylase
MSTIQDMLEKVENSPTVSRLRYSSFAIRESTPHPTIRTEEAEESEVQDLVVLDNTTKSTRLTLIVPPESAPDNYIKQDLVPLAKMNQYCNDNKRTIPAYVKQRVVLKQWDDAYWIVATGIDRSEMPKEYPSFLSFWQTLRYKTIDDIKRPSFPLKEYSYHYLKNSPYFSEFLHFPNLDNPSFHHQTYMAGIGVNAYDETIADIINHPLRKVLSHLPQCLAIAGALAYWDRDEEKGRSKRDPMSYLENARAFGDGTVRPWSYAGSYLSVFPLHREDAQLPSANLHIGGASKIWIALTEEGMDKLQKIVGIPIAACHPHHRTIFYHPSFLIRHDIPFNVAFQQPGDLILSDSRGAHQGWNAGENCAISCNYLDYASITDIKADLLDPTTSDVARWPCVCNVGSRPYQPSVPTNSAKKTRLEAPWFNFVHGVDKAGTSNVGTLGVMLNWVQSLDQLSGASPEECNSPRGEALFRIWEQATRAVFGTSDAAE